MIICTCTNARKYILSIAQIQFREHMRPFRENFQALGYVLFTLAGWSGHPLFKQISLQPESRWANHNCLSDKGWVQ